MTMLWHQLVIQTLRYLILGIAHSYLHMKGGGGGKLIHQIQPPSHHIICEDNYNSCNSGICGGDPCAQSCRIGKSPECKGGRVFASPSGAK